MSITRPAMLSQEDVDKVLQGLAERGARITMADPRVTNTQTWLLGIMGVTLIGVGGWGISCINKLNESMAVVIQQNTYGQRTDDVQDNRLTNHDDRLRFLEKAIK